MAAMVASAWLLVAGSGPALAASNCTHNGPSGTWYCYNVQDAPIYADESYGSGQVGYMHTTLSWFVCKDDIYGAPNGEPSWQHPTRWLWTQGDNGAWGWMSDADIYSETNPVANCY